jgi:hypothetical protein
MLVPTLSPGEIVLMDNLGSHKRANVRKAIEAAGAAAPAAASSIHAQLAVGIALPIFVRLSECFVSGGALFSKAPPAQAKTRIKILEGALDAREGALYPAGLSFPLYGLMPALGDFRRHRQSRAPRPPASSSRRTSFSARIGRVDALPLDG